MDEIEERSAGRRRARIAALAAALLAAIAIVLVVVLHSRSAKGRRQGDGIPAGDVTTSVQRRTLTERASIDGTLTYGSKLELYDRLPGTFTSLPKIGSVIGRGGTLFEVNELPIVLMYGSVPAYRTLSEGVSEGADVRELNENLIALGYDPYGEIVEDARFDAATTAAVKRWQAAEGLPETGEVELGRIVFAPGARRVTELHVQLGQDPPGGTSAKEPSEREPTEKEPARKQPAGNGPKADSEPKGASEPTGGTEPTGGSEPEASAGMPVLTTTSIRQLVQLQVEADQQRLAHVGESVPVTLPDGNTVKGRITSVGTVATASSSDESGGGQATISVTVALEHPVRRLDEAPVTVELVEASVKGALTVPATSLIATAGGRYAIETLQHGKRKQLEVTPGMFADGYVQVEGPGVRAGLTVTEPSE
ncbi:MAG TPA: peptidoglycan-binding protein [Solirubrobacteraceae bacterium]